jgi:uncharacterized protein (TIGR04255 family)
MQLTVGPENMMKEFSSVERPLDLPRWVHPPLDEVAIAVQFNDINNWQIAHYGLLLECLAKLGLSRTEDKGLITPKFEVFGKKGIAVPQFQFQAVEAPLPRVWYISADGHRLAQVQPDRFIFNWRKIDGSGQYPEFSEVFKGFGMAYDAFRSFLDDQKLASPSINQCELSYFNVMPLEEEESFYQGFQRIFRAGATEAKLFSSDSVQIESETGNFSQTYLIKDKSDQPIGRLHAQAGPITRKQDRMLRLAITCRGPCDGNTDQAVVDFFTFARNAIVRVFDSLITNQMHKIWGRYVEQSKGV